MTKFFTNFLKGPGFWWMVSILFSIGLVLCVPCNKAFLTRIWQRDAKTNLTNFLAAEKEYAAKNGGFTNCMHKLALTRMVNSFYSIGFPGTCSDSPTDPARIIEQKSAHKPIEETHFEKAFVDNNKFRAIAVAHLDDASDATDKWSIDEEGNLTHEQNGLASFPIIFTFLSMGALFSFVVALTLTIKTGRVKTKAAAADRRNL